MTTSDVLPVGLSAWIIQDGNYADFRRGDKAAFALEFHAVTPLNRVRDGRLPGLLHTGGANYEAVGRVLHATEEWWAANFGICAFQNSKPPSGVCAGDLLGGTVYFGVDPCSYFGGLSKLPGAPALIYDWEIEKIEMQTAPFMRTGKRLFARDESQRGWKEVAVTDALQDDGGHAEYLLHCRRLGESPRTAL